MSLEDNIAAMARAPLFALLEAEALRLLAFAAETRNLRPGDVLFRRGEPSDGGFVVVRGAIALERAEGEAPLIARPGDLIGRNALFAPMTRPATATAQERSAALRIPPPLMRRVLEEFPRAAAAIQEALAQDLLDLSAELTRLEARFRSGPD